jgi:hypothetical protein
LFWPSFVLVWHSSHPIGCHISKSPRWLIWVSTDPGLYG